MLSTPKKELNALVLRCEKAISIAKAIEIPTKNLYIHTDSLVCMHCICKEKDQLKTYVRNRIQKIQEAELKILYTPGKENRADLTTKSKPTHAYINNKLWINGPDYIEEPNDIWEEKHTLKEIIKNNLTRDEKTSIHNEIKKRQP